jgi:VanZ family protein
MGPVFRLALSGRGLFFAAMTKRFLRYWLPVILWMALVFAASTGLGRSENTGRFFRPILIWLFPRISEETLDRIHYTVRKVSHFGEYAVLGLLVWRWLYYEPLAAGCRPRIYATALLISALYASSDEFHQEFVPGREAAVRDVAIDTCGSGFGLAALWTCRRVGRRG